MARVATFVMLVALLAGCATDTDQDPEPAALTESVAAAGAPSELKREARQLVTRYVVNDLGGTSATVTCERVYQGYVACSATWRSATTSGRAHCEGDFDLDRSNRPLELPLANTSYCVQSSGN